MEGGGRCILGVRGIKRGREVEDWSGGGIKRSWYIGGRSGLILWNSAMVIGGGAGGYERWFVLCFFRGYSSPWGGPSSEREYALRLSTSIATPAGLPRAHSVVRFHPPVHRSLSRTQDAVAAGRSSRAQRSPVRSLFGPFPLSAFSLSLTLADAAAPPAATFFPSPQLC